MNVNKSSYYYWLHNHEDSSKITLYQSIVTIYANSNGIYGSPKITAILNRNGVSISISSVSRIMNLLGIKSIVSKSFYKRKSTLTNDEKSKIVNLIKDLEITHLNQVWTTDITYIQTINEGTFYLISFIDYYSKKVVAWGLFNRQTSDEIITVLKKAIKNRNPKVGLIIHSDKGSQLRSIKYRDFLRKHNFVFSYTSLDHSCDENASQESFHASLKKEHLYQTKLFSFEDAFREIYNYIEGFYNPIRVHSSNGYLSPVEFENSIFCS